MDGWVLQSWILYSASLVTEGNNTLFFYFVYSFYQSSEVTFPLHLTERKINMRQQVSRGSLLPPWLTKMVRNWIARSSLLGVRGENFYHPYQSDENGKCAACPLLYVSAAKSDRLQEQGQLRNVGFVCWKGWDVNYHSSLCGTQRLLGTSGV